MGQVIVFIPVKRLGFLVSCHMGVEVVLGVYIAVDRWNSSEIAQSTSFHDHGLYLHVPGQKSQIDFYANH